MRSAKVESVKQRLKNVSRKENRLFNDVLQMYFLERFLYRLSISEYKNNFVLKGGILLYAIFDSDYVRKTTDIDLLAQRINNEASSFGNIVKNICMIETDDPIRFDIDKIIVKNITEFKGDYHGLNVFIPAYLDRTQGRINIDVGFGDVIYPEKINLSFSSLIDQEPELYAYSLETVIAEKLEAMISLGMLNSRLKDFYDLYVLSKTHDFDGETLKTAIQETLHHRGTSIGYIAAFDESFLSPYKKSQWNSFIRNKDPNHIIELEEVIEELKLFINPIMDDDIIQKKWNHNEEKWLGV